MSSKRPTVLMAILLLVLGGYFAMPFAQDLYFRKTPLGALLQAVQDKLAPLPAANNVSNLVVTRMPDGRWMATVDYAYTGVPSGTRVQVTQRVNDESARGGALDWPVGGADAVPGTHSISVEVFNPSIHARYITDRVTALMTAGPALKLASVSVPHRIHWPDPMVTQVDEALAAGKPETIVQKAMVMIDAGDRDQTMRARALLQGLVDKDPRVDQAYVELARVSLVLSHDPTSLHNAEALLGSALEIRPDSANARILLGFVYTRQARYKEAEALFAEAALANPRNLWLWANWGEVLAIQGRTDAAIEKYREAVTRAPTRDTYDRARWNAYEKLVQLLEPREDLAGIEGLLKQRAQEYAGISCFGVWYARFLVLARGDADGALAVLRDSPSPACNVSVAREVQGLAHYVTWSQGRDPERAESLRLARAFVPVGPALFQSLASTERGAEVAQKLAAAGEKVTMQDGQQFDALAYALRNGQTPTARRLLRVGANPKAEVGADRMPAALIPVLTRNLDGIRLMQRSGIDYAKLRYQGTTAVEYARGQGDAKLLKWLDPKGGNI